MYVYLYNYIYTRIKPLNDRTSDKYKDKIITFTRRCRRRNFMEIIFKEKKKKGKGRKRKGTTEHSLCPHRFPDKNFPTESKEVRKKEEIFNPWKRAQHRDLTNSFRCRGGGALFE